jgi:hypothetical protein
MSSISETDKDSRSIGSETLGDNDIILEADEFYEESKECSGSLTGPSYISSNEQSMKKHYM